MINKTKLKLAGLILLSTIRTAAYFYCSMRFASGALSSTGLLMFLSTFVSAYFMLGFARTYEQLMEVIHEKK